MVIQAAAHLMALTAAVRGMQVYREARPQMLVVLLPFAFLLLAQKIISIKAKWISIIYVLLQVSLVTTLYIVTPFADYWALLLFPASVFVMRRFNKLTGYLFILIFMIDISVMISYAEKEAALEFIPIYIAGFLLISSISLVLQQTTEAKEEAEDLSQRLSQANKQLRQFSERTAQLAILEERTAIARDLHDSATQTLFSANLLLSSLEQNYKLENEDLRSDINKISKLTQTAMTQLRSLIKELKPSKKTPGNFYTQLNTFLRDLKNNHNFSVYFKNAKSDLPIIYRKGLLLIIREALHNSMKHSGVSEAQLIIREDDDYWTIEVSDKGRGFDQSQETGLNGQGLDNIKNRCLQLGGENVIKSSPGEGTFIQVKLEKDEELLNG